ncbi:hypothetical protein QWY86_02955 [Pedobacter aquatilis]|uniref:hypothetical protein n=1 Tax=Pedobacter aquatilis TaxID=351343 RepID=UPI0025B4D69A|nr:hypothetical protein [Pedobacter aquatilis]MDN3585610.1 hypothetical protein [Pedobacter aquatilis]
MINKNLIFTISFTLFALKTFCFQKISSDSTKLTIVIQNSTQNPILIGSGRSYLKLKDYEVISHKKKDTLQLSITGTEFIWYSHKGVEKDTLLISAGDTLILNSNATAIKSIVKYKDATFINRLSLFQEFIKSSEYVSLKYRIDSLKNLFYGTSDTKPTEFFGDFD